MSVSKILLIAPASVPPSRCAACAIPFPCARPVTTVAQYVAYGRTSRLPRFWSLPVLMAYLTNSNTQSETMVSSASCVLAQGETTTPTQALRMTTSLTRTDADA